MEGVANRSRLLLLGRLILAVTGAMACNYLESRYPHISRYAVGAIFGIVVLLWHTRSMKELGSWRPGAFLAASTIIYILVKAFPEHTLGEIDTLSEVIRKFWSIMLDGVKFFAGVLFHTIALPVAHALLLGVSLKRLSVAIPVTLGVWFKVSLLWLAILILLPGEPPRIVTALIDFTSIWQAAYLTTMFAFRKNGIELIEEQTAGDIEKPFSSVESFNASNQGIYSQY